MNDTQIKKEFTRWIEAGRPSVWVKDFTYKDKWYTFSYPAWDVNSIYVVDDHQAELRKLQIDKPDTKFQIWREFEEEWWDCEFPMWNPEHKFRLKPKEWYEDPEMAGKPVWVRDSLRNAEYTKVFKRYDMINIVSSLLLLQ